MTAKALVPHLFRTGTDDVIVQADRAGGQPEQQHRSAQS
jgi:hypothetical protein